MPRYKKAARKNLVWCGDSQRVVCAFPEDVRQDVGYQLHRVQAGDDPTNWKPMDDVGAGTREIRVQSRDGWFRTLYVTKFGNSVHVLHAFQKKSNETPAGDIRIASRRYSELEYEHSRSKDKRKH